LRIEELKVSGVGCPAYALLSYGVASRCQGRKIKKLKTENLIIVICNFYQLLATGFFVFGFAGIGYSRS